MMAPVCPMYGVGLAALDSGEIMDIMSAIAQDIDFIFCLND